MSGSGDFLNELHRTDPWIAAITPERIAGALEGYPLPLADGWDLARLARAIQDTANAARGSPPQGDADAIAELTKLAEKAKALRRAISRMGETAEMAAFWEVFRHLGESRKAEAINQERMRSAAHRLLQGFSVAEVANQFHFSESGAFSRSFRRGQNFGEQGCASM